jgi:hypothetical protein
MVSAQTVPSVYGAATVVVVAVVAEVLLLVVLEVAELLELAGLRALVGLVVWAEQRPLALARATAARNSLRALFIMIGLSV